jgi:hypothetical protein
MKIQKPEARSQRAEVRGQRSEVRGREAKRGEGIGSQGRRVFLLICLLVAGLGISSQAQNTLNVTNYGAIGDAVQFYVNTISNSVVVTTTNQLPNSAIGEAIEVFAAGVPTTATNNQDLVATITNIVNGTNIYVSQKTQATLTNTFATYGHNNTTNFQSAIAAVGKDTNDFIYIPAGTYLLLPIYHGPNNGNVAIFLQRGGIHFVGAGTNSTILLSQGAWTLVNGAPMRSVLAQVSSPITNNFPLSFSYLTMDGGVQQGNTSNHGYPASITTGSGWDVTHDAYEMAGSSAVSLYYTYFTNVLVQHWRGEEFKSVDGSTNGQIGIYNCTFTDGNATALNIYPAWNLVESNLFINLFQVAEYYQAYSSFPGCFEYNICTNISGNGFAINGGKGNNPSFNILNNTFYFSNNNGLETTPGDNILIESNQFIGGGQVIVLGVPGYQGTFDNSNIVVTANTFSNVGSVLEMPSYPPNDVINVSVNNNYVVGNANGILALSFSGWATGIYYTNNVFAVSSNAFIVFSQPTAAPFVLIDTNNIYYTPVVNLSGNSFNGTNHINYVNGSRFILSGAVRAGIAFYLVDTNASQIPANAKILFYNNNLESLSVPVYLNSSLSGSPVTVTYGQTALFYWLSWKNTWSTNGAIVSGPPAPPTNLRQNY